MGDAQEVNGVVSGKDESRKDKCESRVKSCHIFLIFLIIVKGFHCVFDVLCGLLNESQQA